MKIYLLHPIEDLPTAWLLKREKGESKGKETVHVELSSSTTFSSHDNSNSYGSHHHSSIPSPVSEPLLPASPSKSSLKSTKASPSKSGPKSAKSHRSDASAQGINYFRQRNFKLAKKLQEYVRHFSLSFWSLSQGLIIYYEFQILFV